MQWCAATACSVLYMAVVHLLHASDVEKEACVLRSGMAAWMLHNFLCLRLVACSWNCTISEITSPHFWWVPLFYPYHCLLPTFTQIIGEADGCVAGQYVHANTDGVEFGGAKGCAGVMQMDMTPQYITVLPCYSSTFKYSLDFTYFFFAWYVLEITWLPLGLTFALMTNSEE